jgi:hypothetical protein
MERKVALNKQKSSESTRYGTWCLREALGRDQQLVVTGCPPALQRRDAALSILADLIRSHNELVVRFIRELV